MATLLERTAKLGAKLAPWLGWIIANQPSWTKFRHAYDNHADFKTAVDADTEIQAWPAGELTEALEYNIQSNAD